MVTPSFGNAPDRAPLCDSGICVVSDLGIVWCDPIFRVFVGYVGKSELAELRSVEFWGRCNLPKCEFLSCSVSSVLVLVDAFLLE